MSHIDKAVCERASVSSSADVFNRLQTTYFPRLSEASSAAGNMDTDTLISAVYIRTPIWDKRNKQHANRNTIDKLWKEISNYMQHEETVLRKKWKYLREKFASEYSKRPMSRSGDAADSCLQSKWPYFQQLMFLKDIVIPRATSGSITPSIGAPIVPPADTGSAEDVDIDVNIDDATSQCSQDLLFTQSDEMMGSPQENQENATVDNLQFSQGAGPSFQTPVSSKRKRKSQEADYYQRMCNIEERKLAYLLNKQGQKNKDADQEDEDLMFLKTLLPHIRKIPLHMKLRFQSRIQNVVEEFAYGPIYNQPDTAVYQDYYSTTSSPVHPLYSSTTYSSSQSPSTSFDTNA